MSLVLGLKLLIDFLAGTVFLVNHQWAMCIMFAGFAIADLGALLIYLR